MGVPAAANVVAALPTIALSGPSGADAAPPPQVTPQDLPPCRVPRPAPGRGAGRRGRLSARPAGRAAVAEWAAQFHQRYLDLSPIAEHFWVPTTPEEQPVVPLGTIVSGRPDGWDRKGHPDGPELDGIPDLISGPLQGWLVDEPHYGLYYFKHIIGDLDVDPATIETPH